MAADKRRPFVVQCSIPAKKKGSKARHITHSTFTAQRKAVAHAERKATGAGAGAICRVLKRGKVVRGRLTRNKIVGRFKGRAKKR